MKFYPLKLCDGGRNRSKRPHQTNDCVVRSLAIITGLRYDIVYDELAKAGRKPSDGFDLANYMRYRRHFLGHKFKRVTFRRQTTIKDVLKTYRKKNVLIEVSDHVFVAKKGVAYDMIREPLDERVFGLWIF